ncbi:MAG: ABC transporter ATP-binding protein, partial [Bacilli bacterium]
MLEIKNIIKDYTMGKNKVRALNDISLSIPNGKLVAIVGPSGCGKTSLLNILGAMDSDFEGDVIVNGKSLASAKNLDIDSYRKNTVGFIFQHFSLVNSLKANENVELALDLSNVSSKAKKARSLELLTLVDLKDQYRKKVNTLSGGQ